MGHDHMSEVFLSDGAAAVGEETAPVTAHRCGAGEVKHTARRSVEVGGSAVGRDSQM